MGKKSILFLILIFTFMFCNKPVIQSGVNNPSFIQQSSNRLIDSGTGNFVIFKGINFRNYLLLENGNPAGVWIDYGSAYTPSDSDLPFNELAGMEWWYNTEQFFIDAQNSGFNAIRVALNYRIFENDTSPGDGSEASYKSSGWLFLDQFVTWAKAHNLYLIMDMHITPPGVLQNSTGAEALWNSPSAQLRVRNLWKAIARRYALETAIAGYDLLNEPSPPTSLDWANFAQNIIQDIRSVDTNHLIIVEYVHQIIDSSGNPGAWDFNTFKISVLDTNLMYDFHFYLPMSNHQSSGWLLCGGSGNYPNVASMETNYDNTTSNCDFSFLEYNLLDTFSNVLSSNPVNIGEWGGDYLWSNTDAISYVADMICLFNAYYVNRFYYSFDGLHTNESVQQSIDSARIGLFGGNNCSP